MSAIPGNAVTFDFLGNADGPNGLNRTVTESSRRISRLAAEAKRAKVDIPIAIDVKRMERDAGRAKSIIRDVQREADRLFAAHGMGGGGGGTAGGLSPIGAGPLGGVGPGGAGGAGGALGRGIRAGTLLRAAVMVADTGAQLAINRRDMRAATERGDFAGQLAAEQKLNAFARSMPFGIGDLGANIRELATGEQAGIDQTMFEAQQGNQKADYYQTVNERNAKARDAGRAAERAARARRAGEITPEFGQAMALRDRIGDLKEQRKGLSGEGLAGVNKEIAALQDQELELRSRGAAKVEQLERDHDRKMVRMRDEFGTETLRSQGKNEEAAYKSFTDSLKDQEEALQSAIEHAVIRGDTAEEKRLRGEVGPLHALNAQRAANFQNQQERAYQQKLSDAADDRFNREVRERHEDERRVMEGRARGAQALGVEQEGRQIFLRDTKAGRKVGGALRADYERLRDKFQEDMANAVVRETDKEGNVTVTPNEEMRKAITSRFREQIQALIEANDRAGVGVMSSSSALTRGVGLKAPGDDVNRTLKGDILDELRKITKNTTNPVALTM